MDITQKLRCLLVALIGATAVSADWSLLEGSSVNLESYPKAFRQKPPESPPYMVDNTDNKRGVAPVNGEYNGPVWEQSGTLDNYMTQLDYNKSHGLFQPSSSSNGDGFRAAEGGFWLTELGPLGKAPHAGDGYVFYRNVLDYGADNSGGKDSVEAINAAIADGDRCGEECGNTFVQGAIIYFPGGIYKICTPIIQLYHTQFIGDPNDRPIIQGCDTFTGIALIDVDPYVPNMANPDGTGVNWYINQNQFFRQIRNFVFDLTQMPLKTDEHGQKLVPTGIHWQVSQACSLQNLLFKMPTATDDGSVTHVGIFTENGSGGFVSDLEFEGGAIGWRVGSQQYTATSLRFKNCITAVQMIWDWGFNWHKIEVDGGTVAFNISGRGGIDGQGIGSISLIDSTIRNVPIGILTNAHEKQPPNIVIDNTAFEGVGTIVKVDSGETLLAGGSQTVDLWAHGRRYNASDGEYQTGFVEGRPNKPSSLLDGGKLFTRLRPQYEDLPSSSFLIATEHGCTNDATGDNTDAINAFLKQAASSGMIAYFPAGIYPVEGTVTFPTGSKIQGSSWSQIQATGSYFSDVENPKVVVRVGEEGDEGTMEIVDMLFTVKGNTAGAIMMEWNIKGSSQGAAGMWDSHIRVGGGIGTDLDIKNCPKFGYNEACMCVSLLLHVTKEASGYFENVWAWVADHDNDMSLYWEVDLSASQISLYGGRGILVESQGPCWFYGTGSEHVILYQYQTYKAKDIYLGHIQTESPYYQPNPTAPEPYGLSVGNFPGDPDFEDCETDSCKEAWGLRVIDSEGISVHSAGLYSWFVDYTQKCLKTEDCQERIMEVKGSKEVAIYNIFTKGVKEIATGEGYTLDQEDSQQGYTSEVSVWFPKDGDPSDDDAEIIYIGTEVYTTYTAQCTAPCVLVIAPTPLDEPTTISIDPYTTSLEVGHTTEIDGEETFVVTTTTVTITVEPITTDQFPVSNVNISSGATSGATIEIIPSINLPPQDVIVTNQDGDVTTRTVSLPPWPQINSGPPSQGGGNSTGDPGSPGPDPTDDTTYIPEPTTSVHTTAPYWVDCPPNTLWVSEKDATITLADCTGTTSLGWGCPATTTVAINADLTVDFELGCTRWTGTGTDGPEPPPEVTWPPGELEWVEEDGEDDDDDETTTCRLWFFFICIDWGTVKIGGWRWRFPVGTLPPGPPPTIRWPPGITLTGSLPGPWPPVTIGPGGSVTYPTNQPTSCTTETAELCSTSTSFGVTVTDGSTRTTTTSVTSRCATITGCVVEDDDDDQTTTGVDACTLPAAKRTIGAAATATATSISTASLTSGIERRAPRGEEYDHAIIFPKDPYEFDYIMEWLWDNGYPLDNGQYYIYGENTARVETEDSPYFCAFIFVKNMLDCHIEVLRRFSEVLDIYGLYKWNQAKYKAPQGGDPDDPEDEGLNFSDAFDESFNSTTQKRAVLDIDVETYWELSQISTPPKGRWLNTAKPPLFPYKADDSFGEGQVIYVIEDGYESEHPEFDEIINVAGQDILREPIHTLAAFDYKSPEHEGPADINHGVNVLSKIYGDKLGLAKKATVIVVNNNNLDPTDKNNMIHERRLDSLIRVLHDVRTRIAEDPSSRGTHIVNMSFGWVNHIAHTRYMRPAAFAVLFKLLKALDELDVVLICAAHNEARTIELRNDFGGWPTKFGDPGADPAERIDNLIVVGGTNIRTQIGPHSPYADWFMMAPGYNTYVAITGPGGYGKAVGNSLATPMIVGLVAYWRALPNLANGWGEELRKPANVKKLLYFMHRPLSFSYGRLENPQNDGFERNRVPLIWTGQHPDGNCLQDPSYAGCPQGSLGDLVPGGSCPIGGRKRQDGGSCEMPSGPVGSGDAIDTVTYNPGPASPTCNDNCGTLCTGYYCTPSPTGFPPDYFDPEDPEHTTADPGPTDLPPLPEPDDPYTGTECASYSSTTWCNGSGGKSACQTGELCVPTSTKVQKYAGTWTCTQSNAICLRWTSIGRCELQAATGIAAEETPVVPRAPHVGPTATFVTVRTPSPKWDSGGGSNLRQGREALTARAAATTVPFISLQTAAPEAKSGSEDSTLAGAAASAAPEIEVEVEVVKVVELPYSLRDPWDSNAELDGRGPVARELTPHLDSRDVDPPVSLQDDSCDWFLSCLLCATVVQVPCLESRLSASLAPIAGMELTAQVWEDGELRCEAYIQCGILENPENCAGINDFDCGNGYSMDWDSNLINYRSATEKYNGQSYLMYLEDGGDTIWDVCFENVGLRALPFLCAYTSWDYRNGMCSDSVAEGLANRRGVGALAGSGTEILF